MESDATLATIVSFATNLVLDLRLLVIVGTVVKVLGLVVVVVDVVVVVVVVAGVVVVVVVVVLGFLFCGRSNSLLLLLLSLRFSSNSKKC